VSVFNLLKDRGATGTAGILAVVLGASVLLYYWAAPEKKVQDFVGPPRSGYVLTNFDLDS
jgi:lipopolysaccharide export system protein LptC